MKRRAVRTLKEKFRKGGENLQYFCRKRDIYWLTLLQQESFYKTADIFSYLFAVLEGLMIVALVYHLFVILDVYEKMRTLVLIMSVGGRMPGIAPFLNTPTLIQIWELSEKPLGIEMYLLGQNWIILLFIGVTSTLRSFLKRGFSLMTNHASLCKIAIMVPFLFGMSAISDYVTHWVIPAYVVMTGIWFICYAIMEWVWYRNYCYGNSSQVT